MAMCVSGRSAVSRFLIRVAGGATFNEVCPATPILHHSAKEVFGGTRPTSFRVISRNDTLGLRWRAHYRNLCLAWSRYQFDQTKYDQLLLRDDMASKASGWSEDTDTDSSSDDDSDEDGTEENDTKEDGANEGG